MNRAGQDPVRPRGSVRGPTSRLRVGEGEKDLIEPRLIGAGRRSLGNQLVSWLADWAGRHL